MFDLDDWCEERLPAQGICNFVKKVDLEFCFQKIDLKYIVSVSSNSFIQFYEHMLTGSFDFAFDRHLRSAHFLAQLPSNCHTVVFNACVSPRAPL